MKLRKVYLEITNICNLDCEFCSKNSRKPEYMSEENFRTAVIKIKRVTNHIYLHVLGEPTLHPKLPDFLDFCGFEGVNVSLTTNASRINIIENSLINKPCLKQINYSLHSLSQYDDGHRTEQTINELCGLVLRSRKDVYHHLRLWNIGDGSANGENARIISLLGKFSGKTFEIDEENARKNGKNVRILPNVELCFDKRFIWPDEGGKELFTIGRCLGLSHDCAVLVDGTVVPCCLDSKGCIKLGNIFRDELSDILCGERAKTIKSNFSKRIVGEKLCRSCGFAANKFGNS